MGNSVEYQRFTALGRAMADEMRFEFVSFNDRMTVRLKTMFVI